MVRVTAHLPGKVKRHDDDVGVVCVDKLKGEDKANALMKAVTKAKRRATLSICGLGGIPDESEIEDSATASLPREQQQQQAEAATPPVLHHQPAPTIAPNLPATEGQHARIKQLKADCGLAGDDCQARDVGAGVGEGCDPRPGRRDHPRPGDHAGDAADG